MGNATIYSKMRAYGRRGMNLSLTFSDITGKFSMDKNKKTQQSTEEYGIELILINSLK